MTSDPPAEGEECREFLVIPPLGAQFDEPEMMQRIAEALSEEFPDAVFTVADGDRGDEFSIYPILGVANSDTPLARMPAQGVMAAIIDFLEANFAGIPKPGIH